MKVKLNDSNNSSFTVDVREGYDITRIVNKEGQFFGIHIADNYRDNVCNYINNSVGSFEISIYDSHNELIEQSDNWYFDRPFKDDSCSYQYRGSKIFIISFKKGD